MKKNVPYVTCCQGRRDAYVILNLLDCNTSFRKRTPTDKKDLVVWIFLWFMLELTVKLSVQMSQ